MGAVDFTTLVKAEVLGVASGSGKEQVDIGRPSARNLEMMNLGPWKRASTNVVT